ncbi:MAG: CoA ligase [Bacteroidetes bacterium GWF2_42_66]|nr:MAG: CoA ligase [Bacteroidetes bacterium GWA2_42_15]OFX98643.1 MAG: CoA ligase [Bacteroidetes bacterium GWE2_42_39]OFY43159.1 MAG: CoA ligase [Bacteroidetes bacterium GWF2_42_66]HBL76988.1 CoA ligase [Prolixibacteraceae bacterium]HCU59957.1 CoA ligase [Prolixibacteraceae bacterium]
MIAKELIWPNSIVVIGASNNTGKPGGKLLKNLIDNQYKGKLMVVNPGSEEVQGIKSYTSVADLPPVELAVLAIPAQACLPAVETLAREKGTKGFIIISAGFSEAGEEGRKLEQQIVKVVDENGGSLIGPNCIGIITYVHASVFTSPVPKLDQMGCDFISSSGATAVFIMESGIPKGLHFASVFSVGNSAQIGVEDILEFMDDVFNPETSTRVKLLYIESIKNPDKLLKHASSLIRKGCKIAAIKAGSSDAGSRAASSHTGAMANSDLAVEALFRKAGIVRCYGREELTTVANVFMCNEMKGRRIAIITHAGGPAVMLTDALENGGLQIPHIADSPVKEKLKAQLFPGSSVENPIDFLATGTAEQLGAIIDACENDFDEIDGMAVIFGSPGLTAVHDVYEVLSDKMRTCKKPIYPILPSIINVKEDVAYFLSEGNVNFPDEVLLGRALTKVYKTPKPSGEDVYLEGVDIAEIRRIIDGAPNGYQLPEVVHRLFDATGIPRVKEVVVKKASKAVDVANELGFPLVMKVIGPVHKTDVGGVVLNVRDEESVKHEFKRLMKIPGTTAVLMAEMASGIELFLGAKYEDKFGHIILCGMGGILVEVMKDVTSGLAPLTFTEASSMIKNLKSYRIIEGYRGQPGVDQQKFTEIMMRLSSMLRFAVEIKEMDINPLLGTGDRILAVDARIRIEK